MSDQNLATEDGWRYRISRVEKERDLAEETLTRIETERLTAIRERDEAREAARQFFEAASLWGQFPTAAAKLIWTTEMQARWPWLKEIDGSRTE